MKLKKGDQVMVLSGKDKKRQDEIEKIKDNKAWVAGVNLYKKHVKPQGEKQPGGVVEINKPLALSRLALVCPHCKQKTRVGYQLVGATKKRVCKKCQTTI